MTDMVNMKAPALGPMKYSLQRDVTMIFVFGTLYEKHAEAKWIYFTNEVFTHE